MNKVKLVTMFNRIKLTNTTKRKKMKKNKQEHNSLSFLQHCGVLGLLQFVLLSIMKKMDMMKNNEKCCCVVLCCVVKYKYIIIYIKIKTLLYLSLAETSAPNCNNNLITSG